MQVTALIKNTKSYGACAILSELLKQKDEGFSLEEKILREEYEIVHRTLMEEDVQSGWFYHLWLLEETVAPYAPVLVSS
ncbi:hypothetical protein IFM89_007913 [Coptis chinensis]|uniref:Uncharacterized protein n=1 Tax=Coptis chinensis TaxID=261450 RepID=A0A835INR7_9MAGN|nr:hypothetical protein IFM89_007913 [Coptis chinensis]